MSKFPLHTVTNSLKSLPPEVAHQILDDLRVWDILRLACQDLPYITECILSHPVCGPLFNHDKATLARITEYAQLYWAICLDLSIQSARTDWALSLNIHLFNSSPEDIQASIHHAIVTLLETRNKAPFTFERYAPTPPGLPRVWDHSTLPALKQRWEMIQKTQEVLNKAKHAQMQRLALLIERNPDLIKRTRDPEQVRRPNTAHLVRKLTLVGDKVRVHTIYRSNRSGKTHEAFRYPFLPVIPFDVALEFVVGELPKYVSVSPDGSLVDVDMDVRAGVHSPEDLAGIATVIRGMKYLYLPDVLEFKGKGPIYRTVNTVYSAQTKQSKEEQDPEKPRFQSPGYVVEESQTAYTQFMAYSKAGHEPHDEREIEWLEAFVAVYRYLEACSKEN